MRQIVEQIIDDLDGTVLAEHETVTFSVDGTTYEFDTSIEHAEEFRDSLQLYIESSRQIVNGNVVTPACRQRGTGPAICRAEPRHPGLGTGQWVRGQQPRPRARTHRRGLRSRPPHPLSPIPPEPYPARALSA